MAREETADRMRGLLFVLMCALSCRFVAVQGKAKYNQRLCKKQMGIS